MDGIDKVIAASHMAVDWYGITIEERDEDHVVMRSTKCPLRDAALSLADEGVPEDAYCRPHEIYYQDWLEDLGEPFGFKFTKTIPQGDGCCEWKVVRLVEGASAAALEEADDRG